MTSISIVIPVYNEEDCIELLHKEIYEVCEREGYQYEIIIVDDGSSDNTYQLAKNLIPIQYIRLQRNFGQTAAMDAGIKKAQYEYIITMDGDRQNDPNDIPKLIEHLIENDLDVVSGWRKKRKDSFAKRFISRGANFLRKIIINDGIKDSGCSLKIYKKHCFEGVNLYGEMHRFIPSILKIKGFSIGEIEVNHRHSGTGVTKYNWTRTIRGFVDMISIWFWSRYSVRPLHLFGGGGFILLGLGSITGLVSFTQFILGYSMSDTALPILTAFLLFSGLQLFMFGLLIDMVSKIYYERTTDSSYLIKEHIDNKK